MTARLTDVFEPSIRSGINKIYTSMPCRVDTVTYTDSGIFLSVTGLTQLTLPSGYVVDSPTIENVPVLLPSAGGAVISLPVAVNDTVLVNFTMRTLEDWLNGDGRAVATTPNISHSINNATAILGLYAKKDPRNPYKDLTKDAVEIRYKNTSIKLTGDDITISSSGKVHIDSDDIQLSEGTEKAVLGESLKTWLNAHTHPVVSLGSPTSTPTVPATDLILSSKTTLE